MTSLLNDRLYRLCLRHPDRISRRLVGLLAGADDYLVKTCDPSELLARVGALMRRVKADKQGVIVGSSNLTNRERDILGLLADGLDQGAIAQRLSLSRKTVGVHIEHILEKLHVHSRAQAVAAAYREDLIAWAPAKDVI